MPKKSKKNPETLRKEYTEKVAHAVQRVDDWTTKVVKLAKSRHHALTPDQKEKVMDKMNAIYADFESAMSQTTAAKSEDFKL